MITGNYDDSKEITRRLAIARNAMISLTNIWKGRAISSATKKGLLRSAIFSIATYGSECWVLKSIDKKKTTSFELWCYHRLLRTSWTDKKSNEHVLSNSGIVERLLVVVARRKLAFIGHAFRKYDIYKDLQTGGVYGKRGRGRPKVRFSDNIRGFGGSQSFAGLYRLAQD